MTLFKKKYWIFALLLTICISCDDNDNNDTPTWTIDDIQYLSIEYFYTDTINSFQKKQLTIPETTYINSSDLTLEQEVDFYTKYEDGFTFQTNDSLFTALTSRYSIPVDIPLLLKNNELFYSSNPYKLSENIANTSNRKIVSSYSLTPYTQLKVKGSVLETRFNGRFAILYYNRKLQTIEKIVGDWFRYYYENFEENAVLEEIDKDAISLKE